MGVEYEKKYRATPEQLAVIRQSFSEEEKLLEMETTYYDTPDGALSQRFYTLRRRMENTASVCTLKAPEKGAGRGEWEVLCDNIENAIPKLCKLGAPADLPQLTAGGVVPVCGARFTRVAKLLVMDDLTVELALDQGILLGGGKTVPLCEVEVELKSGTRQAADAFANFLAVRFGLTPEKGSKFRRALALSKGE